MEMLLQEIPKGQENTLQNLGGWLSNIELLDSTKGLNSGKGIRTGEQFKKGLMDGRSVWVDGKRIENVCEEDGLSGAINVIAELYDMQFSAKQERMTALDDEGDRISASYLMPKAQQDLAIKRSNSEVWSRQTLGFMGRFPDYCSNLIVGLRNAADFLGTAHPVFAQNAIRYHQYCSKNDLVLTHALNDQFFDRKADSHGQPDPDLILKVVKETPEGIYVRGLKNLATLSPISDEAIVYSNRPRRANEPEQALAFAIPMNSEGLSIICRDLYGKGRSKKRMPLSTRFDEVDATLIFDDVFVPWNRVFAYKNTEIVNRLIGLLNPHWSGYATLLRLNAKLETIVGVLELLAEWDGKIDFPNIQMKIGEVIADISVLKACLRAMEMDAKMTEAGFLAPASNDAYRLFGVQASDRAEAIMEDVAASALIPTGSESDFDIPDVGPLVKRFFKGLSPSTEDQVKIMALAGDMTQSSFGGRTQLYERYHMGSPDMIYLRIYKSAQKAPWRSRVRDFMSAM